MPLAALAILRISRKPDPVAQLLEEEELGMCTILGGKLDGELRDTTALCWTYASAPGLAITHLADERMRVTYTITHLVTGRRVDSAEREAREGPRDKDEALRCLLMLASLPIDWTAPWPFEDSGSEQLVLDNLRAFFAGSD